MFKSQRQWSTVNGQQSMANVEIEYTCIYILSNEEVYTYMQDEYRMYLFVHSFRKSACTCIFMLCKLLVPTLISTYSNVHTTTKLQTTTNSNSNKYQFHLILRFVTGTSNSYSG